MKFLRTARHKFALNLPVRYAYPITKGEPLYRPTRRAGKEQAMDFDVFLFIGIVVGIFVLIGVAVVTYWATTNALQESDE